MNYDGIYPALGPLGAAGYKDINGTKKIMASTQFESLDARRAFPCWDEPARKVRSGVNPGLLKCVTGISIYGLWKIYGKLVKGVNLSPNIVWLVVWNHFSMKLPSDWGNKHPLTYAGWWFGT